jgi:CheY-like chemotaxis protein
MDYVENTDAEVPPDESTRLVKDALEHLYDLNHLQHHSLAIPQTSTATPAEPPGQRLRRELASAIEALNPGPNVHFRAPAARHYNLLRLRYLEGRTVRDTARELNLSLRQAHRDLRQAEESVAAVLAGRRGTVAGEGASTSQVTSFEAELARLDRRTQLVDLRELLESASTTVGVQAAERGVQVELRPSGEPVTVSLSRVVAEQVLVNSLSYAVRQACPGELIVSLGASENEASLTLGYFPELYVGDAPVIDLAITQLADRLDWRFEQNDLDDGTRAVTLRIPRKGPVVLVVDDNDGLIELLRRFLSDQACRVVAAADGVEGLRLAQALAPDAVVLDVMMPGMHGWDFLQRLNASPQTSGVPVIVCSVINNPELAYSLGATVFLSKPVSRADILGALHRTGVG